MSVLRRSNSRGRGSSSGTMNLLPTIGIFMLLEGPQLTFFTIFVERYVCSFPGGSYLRPLVVSARQQFDEVLKACFMVTEPVGKKS